MKPAPASADRTTVADSYRDKLRSLAFSVPARRPDTKATVDRHDDCTVTVTEHLDDRVDVDVNVKTIRTEVPCP